MARRKKLFSKDPYRFGDYERYSGMGSVGGGPFSMQTLHPGQALGHKAPRRTISAREKRLREEIEKERLRRRLEQFRRAEMASRGLPIPAPVDEGLLRSEEASDALAQVEEANRAAASITQPFPTDFSRGRQGQGGVSMGVDYSMLPGTLSRAHGQDDPQNQRGMRGRPWVWPQDRRKAVHDRNVANDLRKREAEQLALQSRRPTPEPWMTGRTGLLDPNWTDATAINVPPKDPRRVAERAARDRLAAATLPADHGQDDPTGLPGLLGYEGWTKEEIEGQTKSLAEERYRRAMLNSVSPTAPSQENLRGTIYGDPTVGQRVASEIGGFVADISTGAVNDLLRFFGAPEEDLLGDPMLGRKWLLRKLQENPNLIRKAKDFVVDTYKKKEEVYPAVKEAVTETIPGVVQEASQAVGGMVDKVPPLMGELQQWAEENVKPVTQQVGREFDRRYALKQEGAEAIARGPDDPGLLTDSGRQEADVGGLLRIEEAGDVTNVPPSQRPQKGLGWPGPGAGATTPTQDDQKTAVAKGSGKSSGSDVAGVPATQLDPATRAGLERVWGKHTYNPAQRRKKYMAQLNNIYRKAMWLDAIAAVSGGQSRSASYIERAVGMMDAMQKFDQEERVYNIWRDVYYDKNGNYDPPKSKKEAAERARRLGANPEETKSIYGWAEEGQDLQQWYRPDGKGGYETTTVKGKKTRPDGEGWIMGNPPVPRTPAKKQYIWAIPPGGTDAVYMDKDVVASQPGWTQSSIDKSGGLYGQSLKQAAQHLKDGDEDAARAVLKQYYARDLMTASLFGDQMDKAIDGLIEDIRASSGEAPATKYASKQEAYAAVMEANPKPAGMSQADYEKRIAARAETVWKEQQ